VSEVVTNLIKLSLTLEVQNLPAWLLRSVQGLCGPLVDLCLKILDRQALKRKESKCLKLPPGNWGRPFVVALKKFLLR
jgi:hypothetical protein